MLVLSATLPRPSGLEVVRAFVRDRLGTGVLLVAGAREDGNCLALLRSGAAGYLVLDDDDEQQLVAAVEAVAQGRSWLSANRVQRLTRGAGANGRLADLTAREREVLTLMAAGLDNAEIAERLVVSKRTVQNHVSAIYDQLGTNNRSRAILRAIEHGLVTVGR